MNSNGEKYLSREKKRCSHPLVPTSSAPYYIWNIQFLSFSSPLTFWLLNWYGSLSHCICMWFLLPMQASWVFTSPPPLQHKVHLETSKISCFLITSVTKLVCSTSYNTLTCKSVSCNRISGADCWNNRSLGDTSTKFGTNDVHDLYFKKCTLPTKKIQDGCHFSRWPTCQSC